MSRTTTLLLFALFFLTGCVRRAGRNTDCRWPGEDGAQPLDPGRYWSAQHLSRDAEFAEQLAISYSDAHHGPHSGHFESREVYEQARNRCLGAMLEQVGKAHGVTAAEVFRSLGHNRAGIDLAVNLPFFLFYAFAASVMARRIQARYPPRENRMGWAAMMALCSAAFGVGAALLGDAWSSILETARVGSGHLSYRGERLPWERYQAELFAASVVLFWVMAAVRYRTPGRCAGNSGDRSVIA